MGNPTGPRLSPDPLGLHPETLSDLLSEGVPLTV